MNVITNDKKTVLFNNSLLDIGNNMDGLTGDELIFYTDQCSIRVTRTSVDVNLEYVREKEIDCACQWSESAKEARKRAYIMDIYEEQCSSKDDVDFINLDASF